MQSKLLASISGGLDPIYHEVAFESLCAAARSRRRVLTFHMPVTSCGTFGLICRDNR
mgnify:CR=1 FL=1